MKISLHSSTIIRSTPQKVVSEVQRAADMGMSGYWTPMLNGMDSLTTLAVAGAAVPGIELCTAVVPIPLRTPYALAQQAATIQAITDGRLVLGIGTSHERMARDLFGAPWGPPLEAMTAYLAELMPLLRGERGTAAPQADPRPPVLLGAVNPRMAAIAAEHADGVVTWAAGLRTIEEVVLAAAAGRTEPFRTVVALPLGITDDEEQTRSLVRSRLGANDDLPSYRRVLEREGVAGVAEVALVGNEDQVAEKLAEFAALGVTEFAAHIVASGDDVDRTRAFLARAAVEA